MSYHICSLIVFSLTLSTLVWKSTAKVGFSSMENWFLVNRFTRLVFPELVSPKTTTLYKKSCRKNATFSSTSSDSIFRELSWRARKFLSTLYLHIRMSLFSKSAEIKFFKLSEDPASSLLRFCHSRQMQSFLKNENNIRMTWWCTVFATLQIFHAFLPSDIASGKSAGNLNNSFLFYFPNWCSFE